MSSKILNGWLDTGVWTEVLDAISDTLKYFVRPPDASPKEGVTVRCCIIPATPVWMFIHCMASKRTPDTHVRHLNCFSDFCAVPWRICSQNIWSKKIYLRLMWSSVSKVASKLLGKCLCGRLASPGPLIIQVRDLLAAQSGGFPACTPEFPFHKRNCSFFQRNILLNLSSCQGRFGQNVFLLHTKNVATEVDFIIRSDF